MIINTSLEDGRNHMSFELISKKDIKILSSNNATIKDKADRIVCHLNKDYLVIPGCITHSLKEKGKIKQAYDFVFLATFGSVDNNLGMLKCITYQYDRTTKKYMSQNCFIDTDSPVFLMISDIYRNANVIGKCIYNDNTEFFDYEEDEVYILESISYDMKCPYDSGRCQLKKIKFGTEKKFKKTNYNECPVCHRWFINKNDIIEVNNFCADNGFEEVEYYTENDIKQEFSLDRSKKCDYVVANGKIQQIPKNYPFHKINFYSLDSNEAIVVGDYNFCNLENHYSDDDDKVCIAVYMENKSNSARERCLFLNSTYCSSCRKFFVSASDYAPVEKKGRLLINVLDDSKQFNITSGEAFEKESKVLSDYETELSNYVERIKPPISRYYTTDDEIDKANHDAEVRKYKANFEEMDRVSGFDSKPYRYRLILKEKTNGKISEFKIGMDCIRFDNKDHVYNIWGPLGKAYKNLRDTTVKYEGHEYDVLLRREVEINNAKLYGFFDAYNADNQLFQSGITDPFLISVLRKRQSQHQLTDILTTIQKKQNDIIEVPLNKNIVVQGCAGSGKTMVMLHRLSRLVAEESYFDASTTLIITPNRHFDMHISNLAIDLRIGGIKRMTVEEYYAYLISLYDKTFSYKSPKSGNADEFDDEAINTSENTVNAEFVDYIYSDSYIEYIKNTVSNLINKKYSVMADDVNSYLKMFGLEKHFQVRGFDNLSSFLSYAKEIGDLLSKSISEEKSTLKRLENDKTEYEKRIIEGEKQNIFDVIFNNRKNKLAQIKNDIENNVLKTMSEEQLHEMNSVVKELTGATIRGLHRELFRELAKSKNTKYSSYCRFYLYSLLLFSYYALGRGLGHDSMLCFDEGQDISLNEYNLLFNVNEKETIFNIYGDTNQLIKSRIRGLSSWGPIKKYLKAESFSLNENYRNTNQITRFCNDYFHQYNVCTGIDGADVEYIKPIQLEKMIDEMDIGEKRIAVIYSQANSEFTFDIERLSLTKRELISDRVEPGSICVSNVESIKGIEFDEVFVFPEKMSRNEKYIAFTRALSKMYIVDSMQNTMGDTMGDSEVESGEEAVQDTVLRTLEPVKMIEINNLDKSNNVPDISSESDSLRIERAAKHFV